jgi:hypothetical protein
VTSVVSPQNGHEAGMVLGHSAASLAGFRLFGFFSIVAS